MRALVMALTFLLAFSLSRAAPAFCGFYVGGADTKLLNRATHVVMMRSGTRTVLSMANAYEGPPQNFAMVVPVPVVLQKDQVKTLPREVLDHVDQLGAPRLVEYWEQDPCNQPAFNGIGFGGGGIGVGQGFGAGAGRGAVPPPTVKIEAQFAVGEYDIVVLSATDSTGLDTWLRENHYKIPDGAEPYLRPYVRSGMKFFVAKVNIAKVTMKDGRAALSPLRFHYDSDTFTLPIRLGLINAGDAQDLVVSILAEEKRYEVTNYPGAVIPTNLEVSDATLQDFGSFYAALFDETLRQKPRSVITEYAWSAGTCDPCPGPTLTGADIATLGGDVVPSGTALARASAATSSAVASARLDTPSVSGRLSKEVVQRIVQRSLGRMRLCYEKGLRASPNLRGKVTVRLVIGLDGNVSSSSLAGSHLPDAGVAECVAAGLRGLSFPGPEGGIATATLTFHFSPTGGSVGGNVQGVTLTRLHMRYTPDALGEDLVFKEAPPIQGGREVRGEGGALEQGAVTAPINNFQARYVIRHPWTGPVACDKPLRGHWGGPPEGHAGSGTTAVRDSAFATRGVSLATFLSGALPPVSGPVSAPPPSTAVPSASAPAAPSASSSAPPALSSAPSAAGGCGCRTEPGSSGAWGAAALTLLALFAARRRRA